MSHPSLTSESNAPKSLPLSTAALAQVADYFKVLSELSRLQVLCVLKSGTKNVSEIMEVTGLGQANVSKHLKILMQAGMVKRQPQGVNVYYEIADPMIFQLCELVCQGLATRLQEQSQQLQQLDILR
ncbi:MAG: metalloregulator ArsR/SmtB family transcription factor [Synechococcales bacterium]|nr:metalloregulator ArsR/SmtB family transcription factor [Synechococcales bacterium]